MIAALFLSILGIYFAIGFLFALIFLIAGGPKKIDPGAVKGTTGFRILILPGCMMFWPLLLKRWAKSESLPTESSAHRIKS
ncbi:MAG: hypothetical protein B7Z37_00625 [Verrucomicrobia bacterium 12-59-8]|nr:MAG: hypothetical protein B7Z37_00625 [Verrucomicrobia bacterium 12-59-8]